MFQKKFFMVWFIAGIIVAGIYSRVVNIAMEIEDPDVITQDVITQDVITQESFDECMKDVAAMIATINELKVFVRAKAKEDKRYVTFEKLLIDEPEGPPCLAVGTKLSKNTGNKLLATNNFSTAP